MSLIMRAMAGQILRIKEQASRKIVAIFWKPFAVKV